MVLRECCGVKGCGGRVSLVGGEKDWEAVEGTASGSGESFI